MLKILTYILSIIVVILTIMPCIDKPLDKNADTVLITQQANDSTPNEADHCSPFCSCQCCQTNFYCPRIHSVSIATTLEMEYFCSNQNIVSHFFSEFYIPPKA